MKDSLKARLYVLLPLFISVLVILASVVLFYYIKGYRFDFEKQEISNTGVLTIDSIPSRSSMFIDEEEYGKTPKSVTFPGGEYLLKIEKEGYHDWEKEITVTEGKSSSIYPWLIAENIKSEEIFSSEEIIDTEHMYQNEDSIFFTLYTTEGNIRSYELWRLRTSSSAWNFSDNPTLILTFDIDTASENTFEILPSPDSSIVLFSLYTDLSKSRYLVDTKEPNILDNLIPITLNGFSDYSITWGNSSKFLLLESDTDILSYDIETGIKYLITKKDSNTLYVFTTDKDGLIYIMSGILEEELYNYTLSQYSSNGTSQKEVISSIYFYKTDSYLTSYKNSNDVFSLPFKNSQESTKTSGKILSFSVEEEVNGMFITSEYAGYWYDLETSKFILVSPYSTSLMGISPLNNQLIFKSTQNIGMLTFKIDDGMPDQYVGKIVLWETNIGGITNIQWLSTGKNAIYNKDNKTYIADSDGSNIVEIYSTPSIFISPQQDASKVFVSHTNEEDIFTIQELDIH